MSLMFVAVVVASVSAVIVSVESAERNIELLPETTWLRLLLLTIALLRAAGEENAQAATGEQTRTRAVLNFILRVYWDQNKRFMMKVIVRRRCNAM